MRPCFYQDNTFCNYIKSFKTIACFCRSTHIAVCASVQPALQAVTLVYIQNESELIIVMLKISPLLFNQSHFFFYKRSSKQQHMGN